VVTVRPRHGNLFRCSRSLTVRQCEALSTVVLTMPLLLMVVVSGLYVAIWTVTGRSRAGGHLGPGPWGSQADWPPFVIPAAVPWAVVGAMAVYATVVVVRPPGRAPGVTPGGLLFWYTLGSTQLYLYGSFFNETPAWSRTPRIGAVVVLSTGFLAWGVLFAMHRRRARRAVSRQKQEQEP